MTILILRSEEITGTVDTARGIIFIGRKQYEIPPGTVIRAGDTIILQGREYTAAEFRPADFETSTERAFQSIKTHDASYMIYMAGIRSGSRVLESGVGNGMFSAHLLWAVSPGGSLTGLDINRKAVELCESNLTKFFGLENWHSEVGDVREYSSETLYDSVFLDIPDPWNAIKAVAKILRPGGSLVVYSPNYNQIERAVVEMEKNQFLVLETSEIIKRNIMVREGKTRPDHRMIGHTAFISIAVKKTGFSLRIG